MELDEVDRVDLEVQLAEVLAELHSHRRERYGDVDTTDERSWPEIVQARLRRWRAAPATVDRPAPDVLAAVDEAIERVPEELAEDGPPTLVHGDVWGGNMVVRRDGGRWRIAALLDPDLQYADVEWELAYLEVFDNPRPQLFDAYTRHHELRPGYERRRLSYWLHTGLVHVALFDEPFFVEFTARTAAAIRGDAPV